MRNYVPARRFGPLIGIVAAVALLSGCAPSASPGPSLAPPASAPMTGAPMTGTPSTGTPPTAEQTAWAGQVCTSTETLKTDITGLVTAATSGGDVSAKLSAQMTTVKKSADNLATTIKSIPAGSENDPERAAVTKAADEFNASMATLTSTINAVVATTGSDRVAALKAASSAASASLLALGSTAQAITTAAADSTSTMGQAFAAAPECSGLTK